MSDTKTIPSPIVYSIEENSKRTGGKSVTLRNVYTLLADIATEYGDKRHYPLSRIHLVSDKDAYKQAVLAKMPAYYGLYMAKIRIGNIVVLITVQDEVVRRDYQASESGEITFKEETLIPMAIRFVIGNLDGRLIVVGIGDKEAYTSFDEFRSDLFKAIEDLSTLESISSNVSVDDLKTAELNYKDTGGNEKFFDLPKDLKYDLNTIVKEDVHKFTDEKFKDILNKHIEEKNDDFLKDDKEKVRPSLVFRSMSLALNEVVKLAEFGAKKYSPDNWLKGDVIRYQDALLRHSMSRLSGEDYDKDSKMLHLVHEAWNTLALLEMKMRCVNFDPFDPEFKKFFDEFEIDGK